MRRVSGFLAYWRSCSSISSACASLPAAMSSSVGSPPDTVGSSPRSGRASIFAVSLLSADMADVRLQGVAHSPHTHKAKTHDICKMCPHHRTHNACEKR